MCQGGSLKRKLQGFLVVCRSNKNGEVYLILIGTTFLSQATGETENCGPKSGLWEELEICSVC